MLKRFVVLSLALILVVTAFVGCAGNEPTPQDNQGDQGDGGTAPEQVLNWNLGADPKTLDPQLNSASDGGYVINNIFEGLMREVNGELQPAAAERYEVSEDGLTYTFYIREDAKWSDGEPLTAQDFEYAWKRALDPETASEYAFQMYYIKNGQEYFNGEASRDDVAVKAIDEKTLEVTLVAPTPYFLSLTSFYTYMPVRQDAVEQDPEGWAKNPEIAISNGPFKLAEYTTGDKIILEKNEYYWNADSVKLDKIVATMIVDESTILTAYESGDLHAIDTMPNQEIPRLIAEDPTFKIFPQIGTYYYVFNVDKEPTNDPKVRRALALAIDRKAIVEQVTKAGQEPATGFVPGVLTLSDGTSFREAAGDYGINPNGANVEEAQKLLAEAGYPNGEGFPTIEVLYNTSEGHKAIAEAIQEMWKQNLGIDVTLTNQEWAVFQDTRHSGNFNIARSGWIGDYNDPMTMLDLWTSYSGNNDAQWRWKEYGHDNNLNPENEEFDKLIEEAKTTTGEERDQAMLEAEKIMMDEMITLPIYYYTDPVMVKENVVGWEKTVLGHWYFGNAEIQ